MGKSNRRVNSRVKVKKSITPIATRCLEAREFPGEKRATGRGTRIGAHVSPRVTWNMRKRGDKGLIRFLLETVQDKLNKRKKEEE